MYRVILLIDNDVLEKELRSLSVWRDSGCFEIAGKMTYADIDELSGFELIIAGEKTGLELLRTAQLRRKRLRVVLCGSTGDFESARRGIVLGAYDYITYPFDLLQIYTLLSRAANELRVSEVEDLIALDQLKEYFFDRSEVYYSCFDKLRRRLLSGEDIKRSAERLEGFYESIRKEAFERYHWLDLYSGEITIRPERLLTERERFELTAARITALFGDLCELYPRHSEQLEDVIASILNYPEGDLRQKTLSAQLHINSTYLSTVFLAQTGIRFVEYVNTVKLKRAAWLLTYTNIGITEIAKRLDYKDNGYFSKLFSQKYGMTPSSYRIPPNYDFQI